jgi:site-specific DNA recombinase
MTKRTAVAIYARISQDRDGSRLGITRQLNDCRDEAERQGWLVAEEYVDDDASAYSGKTRPAYERMLADIVARDRDAVIVWHMDRLHRQPRELEHFVDVCTLAGVTDVRTLHGDLDLGTGDGLMVARLLSIVAANESDAKSRRGKRKIRELAEAGAPHGGGSRPFGFKDDRISHEPLEAQAIRNAAQSVLAGDSLSSAARALAESGVLTVHGNVWRTTTLRGLLLNPRNYGQRVHQGKPIGPGLWEPILSPEDGERLHLLLTDPARRTNRSARRYLLSGLCRCGLCGTKMYSVPRFDTARYLCRSGHDFGGCGRMAITARPLEAWITEAVLQRLDSPEMADALAGKSSDDASAAALHDQVQTDTARLQELAELWADGELDAGQWRAARSRLEQRVAASRKAISRLRGASVVDGWVGNATELRDRWEGLNLARQVAIVRAMLDHIVIQPATVRGGHAIDPNRSNRPGGCESRRRGPAARSACRGRSRDLAPSRTPILVSASGSFSLTGTPDRAQDNSSHIATSPGSGHAKDSPLAIISTGPSTTADPASPLHQTIATT